MRMWMHEDELKLVQQVQDDLDAKSATGDPYERFLPLMSLLHDRKPSNAVLAFLCAILLLRAEPELDREEIHRERTIN